ncbi:2-succinyl-5-enolpyruvyl-6-hydroxy-3-cyclohexene-1-carboxylate synthase [Hymenobacter daecheongensis DSM 21074]|uniref:2-succinyl-5-enolpyruvyl-6-hydroxy-3-cyclohexene-1-carboxylate synthase n=1 Tax=Hymenobacter daecheongensis DSM 21074 TaxID=1121955 RepID=A0A1M6KQG6_9BACT|nr:2-succinyl-5-enolpyruvyl-6-hydroxy-3-cyclohexene-1-carboxylic-acid synthase [Hymenobacter daecheongensis]SHJ61170.1 2-succinyl-5-enolpyruvyl-6-hydroxy-3-cyclohexene-1-carboxylate synthase [Hymenobacter daecheongensis DSM 21074]
MQAIHNIAEICAQHGITDVVLSPGSRCAPLTIAFARHPHITVRTVPDERAAAFIGLGLAQSQRRAVALVCTSGTAGLNYAPAVAEAFFQQIPLVIFTADRPPEWIDQLDGQTIRQTDLYGAHAKGTFTFPADTSHTDAKWHAARLVSEAINLAQQFPAGPVQVNVPLREPFYPKQGEEIRFEKVRIIREITGPPRLPGPEFVALRRTIRTTPRVLVVAGQHHPDTALLLALRQFQGAYQVPVVGDVIANLHQPVGANYDLRTAPISHQDVFLAVPEPGLKAALRPDLLITFGQSLISKALKLYLRESAPAEHWHIQAAGPVADTFKSLTRIIRLEPVDFFRQLVATDYSMFGGLVSAEDTAEAQGIAPDSVESPAATTAAGSIPSETTERLTWPKAGWALPEKDAAAKADFATPWRKADRWAKGFLTDFLAQHDQPFNEFTAFHHTLRHLTDGTALHLANSMAVRYANILGIPDTKSIEVFANRGTSGIDGCTSTAVGAALAQPERRVVLLTGDVAFFYDRNAFWQNYPTPNLRVVLFNNHGGGIFRLIDGPRQQPELAEFFETRQPLTAEHTARDFGLRYFTAANFAELKTALSVFFAPGSSAALLEITTDSATNAAFFEHYRATVRTSFS